MCIKTSLKLIEQMIALIMKGSIVKIFRKPEKWALQLNITPPSGRGLVKPFFFRFFFGGQLSQTSDFRSAKEILFVSFATQPRAFILSDRNIFYTPPGGGGEQRRGLMPLGHFLFKKQSTNLYKHTGINKKHTTISKRNFGIYLQNELNL